MPESAQPKLFIITGGPGAGKTTLIEHLQRRGERCVREAARAILKARALSGLKRPDPQTFGSLMFEQDFTAYRAATTEGRQSFFDRGFPELLALPSFSPEPWMVEAARTERYANPVFIAPPWREIYVNDVARDQTWDEAVEVCAAVRGIYAQLGYRLVDLPRTGVDERIEFIFATIG